MGSLEAINAEVRLWMSSIANLRIHGNTGKTPDELFAQETLQPLNPNAYDVGTIHSQRWGVMGVEAGSAASQPYGRWRRGVGLLLGGKLSRLLQQLLPVPPHLRFEVTEGLAAGGEDSSDLTLQAHGRLAAAPGRDSTFFPSLPPVPQSEMSPAFPLPSGVHGDFLTFLVRIRRNFCY